LFGCVLVLFAACNQTPTEITPLPRALGEVGAVHLIVESLAPLGDNEGTYVVWGLRERSQTGHLGAFFIDPITGQMVDAEGTPISEFTTDEFPLRTLQGVLVTIEPDPNNTDTPAGMQILSGTLIDRVALLTVPISSSVTTGSGALRVFTPTDGPGTNENSGFWMIDEVGEPTLMLPDTTAALNYETFIEINGTNINVGRFDVVDQRDDQCRFCANFQQFPQPERPGDDLLLNAPDGLTFPRDLSGAIVRISLEGRFNDFAQQSQLIVLEAVLPSGLTGGEIVGFVNRTESFPFARAALY
jgi:hypothetical protein